MSKASPAPPAYTFRTAVRSDIGMRRVANQDAVSTSPQPGEVGADGEAFLVVADGMGAHAAGELASKIAVDTVPDAYRRRLTTSPPSALRHAVREANERIHAKGDSSPDLQGMGTTCSCLLATGGAALVAHVGDSRVYRLREGLLEQLTFDHSLVWEMAAASNVAEEKVPSCIPKNVITRSLGPHSTVIVDIEGPYLLRPGDTFLLCSDGLTGVVGDEVLGSVLGALEPDEAAQTLVDLANVGGGPDNVSVAILRVEDADQGSLPAAAKASRKGLSPLALAAAVACLVAGALFLVRGNLTGMTAAAIGLGASIAMAWAKPNDSPSEPPRVQGGPYGDGPYRKYETDASAALQRLRSHIDELAAMISSEADSNESSRSRSGETPAPFGRRFAVSWDPFREAHERAEAAHEAGDSTGAIRSYAAVLRQVVQAVREDDGTHRYPTAAAR